MAGMHLKFKHKTKQGAKQMPQRSIAIEDYCHTLILQKYFLDYFQQIIIFKNIFRI